MSEKSKGKRLLDFRLLRRVFQYAKPYKKKFYISLVLAIVLAVLSPVRPYLIQLTINDFIKLGKIDWIIWITVIQIGLLLLETGFRFYFTFLTAWLGQTVV